MSLHTRKRRLKTYSLAARHEHRPALLLRRSRESGQSLDVLTYLVESTHGHVLVPELVRSGLNAGVLAELEVDRHSPTLLANRRDVRQT